MHFIYILPKTFCMLLYHFRRLKPHGFRYDRWETCQEIFISDPWRHFILNLLKIYISMSNKRKTADTRLTATTDVINCCIFKLQFLFKVWDLKSLAAGLVRFFCFWNIVFSCPFFVYQAFTENVYQIMRFD